MDVASRKSRNRIRIVMACALAGLAAWLWRSQATLRAIGPLPQQAYVFQRDWTAPVRQAVLERGDAFSRLDILAAEISFHGDAVQVTIIPYDAATLRACRRSIGLVLRIGPVPSTVADAFEPDSDASRTIASTIRNAIASAQQANLAIDEFQIDFDCPDSHLALFENWVRLTQSAVAAQSPDRPIDVTITALPSWLNQRAFEPLASLAGSFVLQVHALHQPPGPDANTSLCDTAEARRDIELASRAHVPFLVALPTYTYLAGFDSTGRLLGLLAESPHNPWPQATTWRTMRADPQALAALVHDLTADRPPELCGIIWYRLPVDSDQLNWRWPTLAAVMSGTAPAARLVLASRSVSPGLWEFDLTNTGDDDERITDQASIAWSADDGFIAADGLAGFDHIDNPLSRGVVLRPADDRPADQLPPGQTRTIGWLRLSGNVAPSAILMPIGQERMVANGR